MIDLSRREGRLLRIGHRGAPALAPENTIAGFRAAVASGVDLVEFDVVGAVHGPLLVAHSLAGARVALAVPTFDRVLAFFTDEAVVTGLHVDLKLGRRLDEVAAALVAHGLVDRTVVSSWSSAALRAISRAAPGIRTAITVPRDRLGVAGRPGGRTLSAGALALLRASAPRRVAGLLRRSGATAVMLQHRLATAEAVAAAHALRASVFAWTIVEGDDLARVESAGVDGAIVNDPRLFHH